MDFGILLSQYQHGCYLLKEAGVFFFSPFQFSHFATSKSGDHPQEDFAKFDYKTKREVETLEFLLYFGE
jgi:hypothetical protein